MIRVNNGDRAFRIPVSELSSLVCASANKTAGTRLLMSPVNAKNFHLSFGMDLILFKAKGSMTRNAKVILMVPT